MPSLLLPITFLAPTPLVELIALSEALEVEKLVILQMRKSAGA